MAATSLSVYVGSRSESGWSSTYEHWVVLYTDFIFELRFDAYHLITVAARQAYPELIQRYRWIRAGATSMTLFQVFEEARLLFERSSKEYALLTNDCQLFAVNLTETLVQQTRFRLSDSSIFSSSSNLELPDLTITVREYQDRFGDYEQFVNLPEKRLTCHPATLPYALTHLRPLINAHTTFADALATSGALFLFWHPQVGQSEVSDVSAISAKAAGPSYTADPSGVIPDPATVSVGHGAMLIYPGRSAPESLRYLSFWPAPGKSAMPAPSKFHSYPDDYKVLKRNPDSIIPIVFTQKFHDLLLANSPPHDTAAVEERYYLFSGSDVSNCVTYLQKLLRRTGLEEWNDSLLKSSSLIRPLCFEKKVKWISNAQFTQLEGGLDWHTHLPASITNYLNEGLAAPLDPACYHTPTQLPGLARPERCCLL